MISPSPALRCLSCGYDVASLIAQRGRDEPGVCPECEADLRPSLEVGRGIAWQEQPSVRAYFAFVWASIASPSRVASKIRLADDFDGLIPLHCFAYTLVVMALMFLLCVYTAAEQDDRSADWFLLLIPVVVAIPAVLFTAVVHLFIAASLFVRDRVSDRRMKGSALYAATAIGGAWIALGGMITILGTVAGIVSGIAIYNYWSSLPTSPPVGYPPLAVAVPFWSMVISVLLPGVLAFRGAMRARQVFIRIAPPPSPPPPRT